ncbi:MAG: glycosyltransferase [Anaerolineae bacterium]
MLFLTPDLPYPPHQGAAIRTYNLMRALAPRHEIHLLSFAQKAPHPDAQSVLQDLCRGLQIIPAPTRTAGRRALSVLGSPIPDLALRLPSEDYSDALLRTVENDPPHVVQVEALEMAPYLFAVRQATHSTRQRRPRVLLDDINAEYVIQRRAFLADARQPSRWPAALYSLVQWRKLRRYEARACRAADAVIAVSSQDATNLGKLEPDLPITVVPNGVDTDHFRPGAGATDGSVVFTGKMDFRPNIDAVLWFFHHVWPSIKSRLPQARFRVVGRDPSSRLAPLSADAQVDITGWVPDVRPYLRRAELCVVPLQVGGGTRLKVLEAMAMGKPVLSTSLGCEGLEVTEGEEVVLADGPEAFAEAAVSLLGDPQRRRALGSAARSAVQERYRWSQLAPRLEAVYEEAVI